MVSIISQYRVGILIFLIILAVVLSNEHDASTTNNKKTTKTIKSRRLGTPRQCLIRKYKGFMRNFKCSSSTDCFDGYWCQGANGRYCGGKCKKVTPNGSPSSYPDYMDCLSGIGECSLCGIGNRGISKSCTANSDCTSGWCNNESSNKCGGTCKEPFPNGSPSSYQDYVDCKSGLGECSICGAGGNNDRDNQQSCTSNNDCMSGRCDGVTGNNCSGVCTYIGSLSGGLSSNECSSLGSLEVNFPQLPYGCQNYVDPGADSYTEYLFNTANKDDKPFANIRDKKSEKCTSEWCVRSYSVMQTRLHNYGPNSMLSLSECAKLPKSLSIVYYTEFPYGCQLFYRNKSSLSYLLFNTANEDVKPFSNVAGETNEHCTSGSCVDTDSIMQVWGAKPISEKGVENYHPMPKSVRECSTFSPPDNAKKQEITQKCGMLWSWSQRNSDKNLVKSNLNDVYTKDDGATTGLVLLGMASLTPIVGNFITLALIADGGYEGNQADFWLALVGILVDGVTFGAGSTGLKLAKVLKFHRTARGLRSSAAGMAKFQADLTSEGIGLLNVQRYVEAEYAKVENSGHTLYEWPDHFDPQDNLNAVNAFALKKDSFLRYNSGFTKMTFPIEITSGEFIKDKQVGYTVGAYLFYKRINYFAQPESAVKTWQVQWYITKDLLQIIKDVRGTVTTVSKIECEHAKWKIRGYLDRISTLPLFHLLKKPDYRYRYMPFPYDQTVIRQNGYPNPNDICDIGNTFYL